MTRVTQLAVRKIHDMSPSLKPLFCKFQAYICANYRQILDD